MQQLALDLQPTADAGFDDFRAGRNAELVGLVRSTAEGNGEPCLFFWGAEHRGKTHLLQAAAHGAIAAGLRAAYLPLAQRALLSPGVAEGLEGVDLVCLDDLQGVTGESHWEEALFHLFNRLRARKGSILACADRPLAALPFALPDLRSRLAWGPSYELHPLDDGESLALLIQTAHRLGMRLTAPAGRYILHRCRRDASHLIETIQRLGRLALERHQRPSIALIRELLLLFPENRDASPAQPPQSSRQP